MANNSGIYLPIVKEKRKVVAVRYLSLHSFNFRFVSASASFQETQVETSETACRECMRRSNNS